MGEIAILRFVGSGFEVDQAVLGWTDELVLSWIIGKGAGLEAPLLHWLGLARWMLFLVEGVVLEEVAHLGFFQPGIVFFTAIAGIPHAMLEFLALGKLLLLHVGNEATGIVRLLVNAIAHHKLSLGAQLHIVGRTSQRSACRSVFLHAQTAGIGICF